ncbi:leucine-rich repeat-containing protein 56 isoform X2 [Oenanthe melanoleuca]|uniref:leucine-rich repeat-containing protein 56 isoform X2 n=1 Tax=Oenanthe melanoleuca TaxID=2939378 RepID=UPI0024C17AF1|nr:leucine-rich repeat-containing protein 56 isoform X2 [Oenanthe melanoleuca]XP_056347954.1 leucine-rich repeat-containing protein 56 isoform X2 [Oenanthe melanoleuca]
MMQNSSGIGRKGSSEDQETDLNWQGNPNPSPLIKDDGELLMDEHLSPRKLKVLAGVDDLKQVKALEMRVDTREISLGNFGVHLPNLRELKLNNSLLASVRDLGTSLSHLHVLWMARCGLSDLDGISSCSSLKELYIAYNNISDLSQLTWLDHLEVLDLEGNNIEDINQLQFLRLCCKLSHLTVEGNLICLKPTADSAEDPDYNYRAEVKKLIPHLKYLDRIRASQTALPPSKKMHEDSLIIKESIKDGGLAKDISWLDPTVFPDKLVTEDDSSDLTHGLRQVICGNPAKALHERRQKLGSPAVSPLKPSGLKTENPCGSGGGRDLHQEKVSPDLGAQTEQHKGCLQTGQQEQTSQALKVNEGEDKDKDLVERISLDPSSHSSSGLSQAQEGAVFSNTKPCLIPTPPKNRSPASAVDVAARPWKTRNHRSLKIPSQEEDRQCTQQSRAKAHQENSAQPLDKEPALLGLHSTLAASGSQEQHQSVGSTSQQRPIPGPAAVGSSRTRTIMDESPSKEINHQHPAASSSTKASQRFRPMNSAWPLTAKSILQPLAGTSTATKTSQNRSLQS